MVNHVQGHQLQQVMFSLIKFTFVKTGSFPATFLVFLVSKIVNDWIRT